MPFVTNELEIDDDDFKTMILHSMNALKSTLSKDGKCLPNTKAFFTTFEPYFSKQNKLTKDINEILAKLKEAPNDIHKIYAYHKFVNKEKINSYLKYFEFLSY